MDQVLAAAGGRACGLLVVERRGHGVPPQPVHGPMEFFDGAIQP
jgi:hypothetical protein